MTEGWSRADQAELNAILWFWLGHYYDHTATCPDCGPRQWCPRLSASWDAVEGWRHTRMLLSRAEHLRACQRLYGDAMNEVRPGVLDGGQSGAYSDPRQMNQ